MKPVKFKVGQKVVILPGGIDKALIPPTVNAVYTVENPNDTIGIPSWFCGGVWVQLAEMLDGDLVNQDYLRPVIEITDSQFEELEKELTKEIHETA